MSETQKEAERRYRNWICDREAFVAGAEYERTREVTDAEVEAAAKAIDELDWEQQHGGVDPSSEEIAIAALKAAREVQA